MLGKVTCKQIIEVRGVMNHDVLKMLGGTSNLELTSLEMWGFDALVGSRCNLDNLIVKAEYMSSD